VKTRQKRRRPKVPSSFYFLRVVVVIPHDSKEMEGRSHEMKTTIVLHYVAERERERRCKNAAFGSASRTGHQPNTERVRREKGRETRGGWITELEISWGQVFKRE
jgi:hypothetical protein